MQTKAINIDSQVLGGTPVFTGTRVPIASLFDYLGNAESLDVFLNDFPSVSKEQAVEVIRLAESMLMSPKFLNENSS